MPGKSRTDRAKYNRTLSVSEEEYPQLDNLISPSKDIKDCYR